MAPKFPVGSRVICVDNTGIYKSRYTKGKVYVVQEHKPEHQNPDWEDGVTIKGDDGMVYWTYDWRWKLADEWNASEADFADQDILASGNPKDLIGVKKPSFEFIPMATVMQTNEAFRDGAAKYGAFNWRQSKVRADVYYNAALRHITQWYLGNDKASDSKIDHRAHAIACLMILMDAEEQGSLIDNRPKVGVPLDEFIQANTKD